MAFPMMYGIAEWVRYLTPNRKHTNSMSIQNIIADIEMLLGVHDDDACDMFENYRSQIRATLGERRFRDLERRVYSNARKAGNFANPIITTIGGKPIMEIKSKVLRNAISDLG